MPISANSQEGIALEIRRIYADAEEIMLSKVAKRLKRGIDQEGWAEKKLQEVQAVRKDIERQIAKLRKANDQVEEAVAEAYKVGSQSAVVDLKKVADKAEIDEAFTGANEQMIQRYAQVATNNLDSTHRRILRATDDIYRRTVAETSAQVLTGTQTRRQATQAALNRFADKGVSGFIDSAGRAWDMASYAEMATRTAAGKAAVQGHVDRLRQNSQDLVIISGHEDGCPICDPWEGEVLSLTGDTEGYPTLAEAEGDGLFHPNCGHTVGLYVEGLTQEPARESSEEKYGDRQTQRYNERAIRKWKKREAVAITPEDERKAKAKIREWQAKQRQFLEGTERRRRYERESITRAR